MISALGSPGGYIPLQTRAAAGGATGGACAGGACAQKWSKSSDRQPCGSPLTETQQKELDKLRARDSEVRQHEQAHLAAAGGNGRGPIYEFTKGPDGKQYATGGHVEIDTTTPPNPREALRKARQIRRAALSPGEPSGQDRSVAARASQMEQQAQDQIRDEEQAGVVGSGPPPISSIRQLAQAAAPTRGAGQVGATGNSLFNIVAGAGQPGLFVAAVG